MGGGSALPSIEDIKALSLAADIGTPRVDLVMFADPDRPKDEQGILALVEFKKGWISAEDGVVCGWTDKPDYPRGEAQKADDHWFERPFDLGGRRYFLRSPLWSYSEPLRDERCQRDMMTQMEVTDCG